MQVITDIKVLEVREDWMDFVRFDSVKPSVLAQDIVKKETVEVDIEKIYGKRFVSPKKGEFIIGMSQEVQDLIGIPFKAFDNMEKLVEEYRLERNEYKEQYKKIEQFFGFMPFWSRFKFWLFPKKSIQDGYKKTPSNA